MNLFDEVKKAAACDSIEDASTVSQKAVCIAAHPGRIALYPLIRWYDRRYHGKYRFARLTFLFDLVLVGIALGLGLIALALAFFKPHAFADRIVFQADVAPHEVVSGAPSTLVIRYSNDTGEELRNAKLLLGFPAHFLLQGVESESGETHGRIIDLGTVPPNGIGSVKVRGVMFGDVGGEQAFVSTLTFTHGETNVPEAKTDTHVFSPSRSTLELALALPDRIVAAQPIEGTLSYRNAGDIDFPEISIEPAWPDGFALMSGTFDAPGIAAGEEGTIAFRGVMGDAHGTVTFTFYPSFAFGDDRYRQETLTHDAEVVPLPLQVSHSVDPETVRPGGSARITVTYANVGDQPVTDVRLGAESESPFAKSASVSVSSAQHPELARVEPGETGTIAIDFPLYASISQSATSTYEHIPFATRAFGAFDMDGVADATARDGEVSYVMTSPVVLDSFGRYATPTGDQIGRGPLPPLAGDTTKYWVFWNLRGTTNELTNVRIEGELGPNVAFTGRQTVSTNGAAEYDPATGEIAWTTSSLEPTFAPSSRIVGIAFEVALTPADAQIGTIPTLLKNIRVTATDAVTGAFVSASGGSITTSLPSDAMAAGLAAVE